MKYKFIGWNTKNVTCSVGDNIPYDPLPWRNTGRCFNIDTVIFRWWDVDFSISLNISFAEGDAGKENQPERGKDWGHFPF